MSGAGRPAVRVYTADTAPLLNPALFDALCGAVSRERLEKIGRMRFRKDQCLSLGVELLLLRACRDFGVDYSREQVVCGENGKPRFADNQLQFNLSHSEERVMCVMSSLPAGCDVEKIRSVDMKIARRFFFEDEYRAIEAAETEAEREDLFFRFWTLKESFMKCTGLGFKLPLNEFSVSGCGDAIRLVQSVDSANYLLREWAPGDGCRYARCLRDPSGTLTAADIDETQETVDLFRIF